MVIDEGGGVWIVVYGVWCGGIRIFDKVKICV